MNEYEYAKGSTQAWTALYIYGRKTPSDVGFIWRRNYLKRPNYAKRPETLHLTFFTHFMCHFKFLISCLWSNIYPWNFTPEKFKKSLFFLWKSRVMATCQKKVMASYFWFNIPPFLTDVKMKNWYLEFKEEYLFAFLSGSLKINTRRFSIFQIF